MNDTFFAPESWATPDFIIRTYYPTDGPLLNEAVNSSYEHLKTFLPWAKPYTAPEESQQLARTFAAHYLTNEEFVLAIFNRAETRLLGGSGFHLREGALANRAAEIGMWIRADAAGQGLGTRVLLALLEWGFSAWPWERLSWRCDTRNIASRRTAEKAGMQLEGCLRAQMLRADGARSDIYTFAALRSEWKNPAIIMKE